MCLSKTRKVTVSWEHYVAVQYKVRFEGCLYDKVAPEKLASHMRRGSQGAWLGCKSYCQKVMGSNNKNEDWSKAMMSKWRLNWIIHEFNVRYSCFIQTV